MGLDMYLTKQVYVKNWDHYPADQHWKIQVAAHLAPNNERKPGAP